MMSAAEQPLPGASAHKECQVIIFLACLNDKRTQNCEQFFNQYMQSCLIPRTLHACKMRSSATCRGLGNWVSVHSCQSLTQSMIFIWGFKGVSEHPDGSLFPTTHLIELVESEDCIVLLQTATV